MRGKSTLFSTQASYDEIFSGKLRRLGLKKPLGDFYLSLTHGGNAPSGVSGYFVGGDGRTFQLSGSVNDIKFRETDETKEPPCPVGDPHKDIVNSDLEGVETAATQDIRATATARVKVLVMYTTNARDLVGGTNAILSQINTVISYANTATTNSGIDVAFDLAGTGEVTSVQTTEDFEDSLNYATNLDGIWDDIHTKRTAHGADLVIVMINNPAFCGLGWLMTINSVSFAPYGFSVLYPFCGTSGAHEMAHNMGAQHDVGNAGGQPGVLPSSYGFRWTGNSSQQWRSVMAYAPGTRVAYFSNPNVSYDGVATGTSGANNANTLNLTGSTAASFLSDPVATPTPTWTPGGPTATPTPTTTPGNGFSNPSMPGTTPTPGSNSNPKFKKKRVDCGQTKKNVSFDFEVTDQDGAPAANERILIYQKNRLSKALSTGSSGKATARVPNKKDLQYRFLLVTSGIEGTKRCQAYRRR